MKLWGGRFKKAENKLMEDFNSSLGFDRTLYYEDIQGSKAHVKMLAKCGILTQEECESITTGLNSILSDIENDVLQIEGEYEDIHSFVETNLIERIGQVGKKLHTSRSRNDQVAVDLRLYAKKKAFEVIEDIDALRDVIVKVGEKNNYLMPGYTHLQRAQVVTFKHHIMAYHNMLTRDKKRVENAIEIMDESPLGCCALAGTTYNIDRSFTAKELGFKKPVDNFLDGVSDRDYVIELLSCFSIMMMHLSRLSEELILWSSKEFDFILIDDEFSTGSSIMPQKKNPDAAELIRGKTGRVYGSLMALLTTMKGIPLAYNKDMQEDKELTFDAIDTVKGCLALFTGMISSMTFRKDVMEVSAKNGFTNATDAADYLVNHGVPFRDAHGVVGQLVLFCIEKGIALDDMTLDEYKAISPVFEEDIYDAISLKTCVEKRMTIGAPGQEAMKKVIEIYKRKLEE